MNANGHMRVNRSKGFIANLGGIKRKVAKTDLGFELLSVVAVGELD
jgi:hypothetical protein